MYTIKHKDKEFSCAGYKDALWLARVIAGNFWGEQGTKVEVFSRNQFHEDYMVAYAVPNVKGGSWLYDSEGKNLDSV